MDRSILSEISNLLLFRSSAKKNQQLFFIGFWLISMLTLSFESTAQDIHVSQFHNAPLLRNPALAGVFTGDLRFQLVHRNQWASVAYPYRTSLISYDQKFKLGNGNDFISTGLTTFFDQAGIQSLKTTALLPVINYHKSLSQQKSSLLSAGFMAGLINRQFDLSNLTFDNQYVGGTYSAANPTGENFSGLQKTLLDLAAGVNYNGQFSDKDIFYAGISLWHFHQPTVSFLDQQTKLPVKWQASMGYRITTSADVEITAESRKLTVG
ncbi:MAG: PorP/SprF family type IX secretion system membrane protein [Chitinophagaceae bacterium]